MNSITKPAEKNPEIPNAVSLVSAPLTRKCPICAMTSDRWTGGGGDGVRGGAMTYCCGGCAQRTGCECAGGPRGPRGR